MMGFEIVILAIIVGAIVLVLNRGGTLGGIFGRAGSAQTAKEILQARLARGEISPEEYKKLLETLEAR